VLARLLSSCVAICATFAVAGVTFGQQLSFSGQVFPVLQKTGCPNFHRTWVYDSQLIELARLPRLEQIDLSHTRISDEGMLYLKTAPAIIDLNLLYTEQITDQGINAIRDGSISNG
jgi:hypothetical protein